MVTRPGAALNALFSPLPSSSLQLPLSVTPQPHIKGVISIGQVEGKTHDSSMPFITECEKRKTNQMVLGNDKFFMEFCLQ